MKWYSKAAEQGFAGALSTLDVMYARGWGVIPDNAIAHMWSNLPAGQGDKSGTKNRDIEAKRMPLAAIEEAQRLAS